MKNYKIKPLPREYIDKHFSIDDDGVISRSDRKGSLGSIDKDGYLILKIKSSQYKYHRVAYYLHHGKEPSMIIDHKDRNKLNNRKDNLRDVPQSENVKNTKVIINKDTNIRGVYLDKTKGLKRRFATRVDGRTYRFNSAEEAKEFRISKNYPVS